MQMEKPKVLERPLESRTATHHMDRSSLMKRLLDLRALVVAALLLVSGSALAQSVTFGVSAGYGMDTHRPTKLAASALVTLGEPAGTLAGNHLGVRLDASIPLNFAWFPSIGGAVVFTDDLDGMAWYAGMGADVRWLEVNDVRCYEATMSFIAGLDIDVYDNLAVRTEITALPFTSRIGATLGLAYTFDLN